ncbi:MAG: diguanylate cyclase [Syntrophobacterales bacterium]|nr:diguanylate cyclase [Syntrophobacterales bacterium]
MLVVDDHPVTRRLLEVQLQREGYRVLSAAHGREALERLGEDFCPLVLTDWMMPEMDGLELCRAIRGREWDSYVYLILLTARDALDDVLTGLEAGADDYLVKPVHPMELLARLRTGRRILDLERTLKERTREIARLAVTDPLTGVYNRRYLMEQLPRELRRARRYRRPLALILCDLDHFKGVNDTLGHKVGDEVLQEFTRRLGGQVRQGVDWLARYGGEEFVFVLPETDLAGCLALAWRLRELVAAAPFPTSAGPVAVTASFGVAALPATDAAHLGAEALLAQADACLYQAKAAGRNRVAGPEGGTAGRDEAGNNPWPSRPPRPMAGRPPKE